jgi:predicted phage tail protein
MSKIIRGSGGGGPKTPPKPTRAPDTLNSRQFVTLQDLISEGEIEGWATASKEGRTQGTTAYNNAALKDVYLDNTPVLNPNADSTNPATTDFNFQEVTFTPRFGTSSQTHIPGIVQSSSPVSGFPRACTVANGGVTQQITSTNVDAVRLTINFPQLQEAKDNGDLLGSSVQIKVQIQYNSGGYSDLFKDTITGRTSDSYSKDYRVEIDGAFPVDIKVVRLTADSTNASLQDSFNVLSMQELVDEHQTYTNSAYAALKLDSKIVSNIPNRKYRIRGVKIRIPGAGASASGTPTVDSNTGRIVYPTGYIFNGTMAAAQWCSCPAMVLLDLLTTVRYGLGDHIADSNLDLFSFVNASKFANELVDDGFGGQEARFSCNVNILSANEAFNVIEELCGVMRCMPIWSAGTITIAQDKPTDASFLFSLANVTEEGFSYSGSSLKTRHSVVAVSYYNMDSREIDYEVVEDSTAKTKLGVVKKDVRAFACTSRGQAQRLGKAILFAEQNESEVVAFTTSVDAGVTIRPGAVIDVNDPVRSGARRSGRINTATTTAITIDDTQGLSTFGGANQKVSVLMPDNSVETKNVLSTTNGVISLDSALSEVPNVNSIWFLVSDTIEAQKFRVITVEEADGINYKITALSYKPNKYANIEEGLSLPARNVSILNAPASPPTELDFDERTIVRNGVAISRLFVTWVPVNGVSQYLVQYRFANGNYESQVVFRPDITIDNSELGTYEFKVFSFNAALEVSNTSLERSFSAEGKTALPTDVQNLTAEPVGDHLMRLRWDQSTDADVLHGGRVYVRHSNKTDGSGTFAGSVDLVSALAGTSSEAIVPALEGEYILKFQDDGGRFSAGEASVVIDIPDVGQQLVVLTKREDLLSTPFSGTKTNVSFTSGALQLTNPSTNATGTYAFADTLDLGGVFTLTLKRHIQSLGVVIGNNIDDVPDFDNIVNFDGDPANDTDCQVFVKTSTDASSYGDFNAFANGEFKARAFQFKANVATTNTNQNINVQQLGYSAILQSRTEQSTTTIASGAGAKNVTFSKPFFVGTASLGGANAYLPSIGITAQGMQSGDFFELSNVSGTGFTVHFKNGSTSKDRNFSYQAVGFGKGV